MLRDFGVSNPRSFYSGAFLVGVSTLSGFWDRMRALSKGLWQQIFQLRASFYRINVGLPGNLIQQHPFQKSLRGCWVSFGLWFYRSEPKQTQYSELCLCLLHWRTSTTDWPKSIHPSHAHTFASLDSCSTLSFSRSSLIQRTRPSINQSPVLQAFAAYPLQPRV